MYDSNSIGDKIHYILECTHFVNNRKMFLFKRYYKNPNMIKFNDLMNTYYVEKLKKNNLSRFIMKIFKVCSSRHKPSQPTVL